MREFRELKEAVGKTTGKRLPTAKELRECGADVLFMFEHGDVTITVYLNGFFVYECYGKETVFAVDRCREIIYKTPDGEIMRLKEKEFSDGPCIVPLLIRGDDRIVSNIDRYERYWTEFSMNEIDDRWKESEGSQSAEDELLHQESLERIIAEMKSLTQRQRDVVRLYCCEGMSQYEIADVLHLKRTSVQYALNTGMKRLKNVL